MSFNIGDRVILIKGTSSVPSGSKGTVSDMAGNNVEVDFGAILGVLTTTAQNLRRAGGMVAIGHEVAALANVGGDASPSRQIHWAQPAVEAPVGDNAANLSVTLAPSNGASVLFNNPAIELQGAGSLAGIRATTLTFPVSGNLQMKAPLNVHVRGFVATSKNASTVLLAYLDGKLHRKEFKRGKIRTDNFVWELTQTLPANATTQVIPLVVLVERASVEEHVTATIDSLDISLTEVFG